jgi:hypothetical protein
MADGPRVTSPLDAGADMASSTDDVATESAPSVISCIPALRVRVLINPILLFTEGPIPGDAPAAAGDGEAFEVEEADAVNRSIH